MKCYKIRFDGYKRLADTECNVDGRIIAFVGPNEVGKTSVLSGLEWLTRPGSHPLPFTLENRTRGRGDDERVIEANYFLDDDDRAVLTDLGLAEPPTEFRLLRRKDGGWTRGLTPYPKRDPRPFDEALRSLRAVGKRLAHQLDSGPPVPSEDDEDGETSLAPKDWHLTMLDVLQRPDDVWEATQIEHARLLVDWLRETAPTSRSGNARDDKAAGLLEASLAIGSTEHPVNAAHNAIHERVPRFVLFSDQDRELTMTHELADEGLRASPPGALRNLLQVADIDLSELWEYIEKGADTRRETLMRKGNARLRALFSQAWNQEAITVHLNLTGTLLQVMIDELNEDGSRTSVEERSDGLQTFIALVAFLAKQNLAVPPILLVDEAETHLHLDAQADLVDVLLQNLDATQVFYTTHSPGCLPRDLGTSVRLVKRDPSVADASLLKADFWTNEEPGFSPLLFAMGASAAAFSVCRRAVLAEGAADMILLPSMIRKATGLDDVGYQVAPGLSNAHAFGMDVEAVAARVVYLTDGDKGGQVLKDQLLASGVPDDRVFSMPKDGATEDLLDTDYYLRTVNRLMPSGADAPQFKRSDIKAGTPVGKSLAAWGKRTGNRVPGKVAVAAAIAGDRENLVLANGAADVLSTLHSEFSAALNRKPAGA